MKCFRETRDEKHRTKTQDKNTGSLYCCAFRNIRCRNSSLKTALASCLSLFFIWRMLLLHDDDDNDGNDSDDAATVVVEASDVVL